MTGSASLDLADPELVFVGQIASAPSAPAADAAAQTSSALARLETELATKGLALDDLLRLRLFVADPRGLPAVEQVLAAHAQTKWPAVSIIALPSAGDSGRSARHGDAAAQVGVTLDAVAAPGAHEQRRLAHHSARLGPWVFVGAIAAAEPRGVFPRMAELLYEQGAELRDVVRLGSWLTFPMRDYGPLGAVRQDLVASAGLLPASAGVQIGRVGATGERLACEAIAFAPADRVASRAGSARAESARAGGDAEAGTRSRLADFYVDARAAGGYVFTSGEVPDERESVRQQATEVYERLRAHLAAHGATPADVVQQTVFVRRPADGETVAGEARALYGVSPVPPTTLLTVADLGFKAGCEVEVELIAALDRPANVIDRQTDAIDRPADVIERPADVIERQADGPSADA